MVDNVKLEISLLVDIDMANVLLISEVEQFALILLDIEDTDQR